MWTEQFIFFNLKWKMGDREAQNRENEMKAECDKMPQRPRLFSCL